MINERHEEGSLQRGAGFAGNARNNFSRNAAPATFDTTMTCGVSMRASAAFSLPARAVSSDACTCQRAPSWTPHLMRVLPLSMARILIRLFYAQRHLAAVHGDQPAL